MQNPITGNGTNRLERIMVRMSERTLNDIDEWQKKTQNSAPLMEFYKRLINIQSRAERQIGSWKPSLSSETYSERLQQGLPLLRMDELELDCALFQNVFIDVTSTFAAYPQLFNIPEDIAGTVQILPMDILVRAWFEREKLPEILDTINEDLLFSMISTAMKPFLTACSEALSGYVDQQSWRRGYCPVCGGSPDFALLEAERGARWLVCSQCDTKWLFQRLECPYCGTQDQDSLAYLTDDKGLYRLYTCERCKRYLKAIDLRYAKTQFVISLERLFTLHIDAQGRSTGYS
jgi:FdhE protein